jgi:valyl-tRNA synthetase
VRIDAVLVGEGSRSLLLGEAATISHLAGLGTLAIRATIETPPERALRLLSGEVLIYLPLAGLADLTAQARRVRDEVEVARAQREKLAGLLANESFVARAPAAVIERERTRLVGVTERLRRLEEQLAALV